MAHKHEMHFTGERAMPLDKATPSNVMQEHLARYRWAQTLVGGQEVLDVACGAGYGSAMLAEVAANVIGGDISAEAVDYSAKHYPMANLEFRTFDICAMPLPEQSVDAVVSFETIEHVADGMSFLREVSRVLRPHGQLLISVPLGDGDGNKFHLAHYQSGDVEKMLQALFSSVEVKYQRGDTFNADCLTSGGFIGEYAVALCSGKRQDLCSEIESYIVSQGSENTLAFGGGFVGGILCQQMADEFSPFLQYLMSEGQGLENYLEIGSAAGGSAYLIDHFLHPSKIVLVDDNQHHTASQRGRVLATVDRHEIIGASHDAKVSAEVKKEMPSVDLLFLDGGHTYSEISADIANYLPLVREGGYLALHDSAYQAGGGPAMVAELQGRDDMRLCAEFISQRHPSPCGLALFQKL